MKTRSEIISAALKRVDGHAPSGKVAKHRKMAVSPFTFLRGASQLFYADILSGVLPLPEALLNIPMTYVMGDCHTGNFGFITEGGSHGDKVIFCPNDYDDACIGHAAWDIVRFCVSLILVAEHGQGMVRGVYQSEKDVSGKSVLGDNDINQAIDKFLSTYRDTCGLSIRKDRKLHDSVIDDFSSPHILYNLYRKAQNRVLDGEDFTRKSVFAKSVDFDKTPLRFKDDPERFKSLGNDVFAQLEYAFAPYMNDAIIDIVERVDSGIGSANMKRYYFLIGPRGFQGSDDLPLYHVVEIKQQREAAALFYFPDLNPVNRLNPAHLSAVCQQRMQRQPDLLLSELEWNREHWLVHSRHHARIGINPEDIAVGKKATRKGGFLQYAQSCAEALALAHCRGDRRSTRFERAVCDYLPGAMTELKYVAEDYAQVVTDDWARLVGMVR
ncbi:MAG: hypothetical protein COA42_23275 [Alteromonadaceae bacterium]|nr:MAG: hypothetical protein COA42_23275 [Alteromonadaceae bacterium]